MKTMIVLGWQWDSPGFMLMLWPVLYLLVLLSLGYLIVRFLLAGLRFFKVLTAYFEQRTENERRPPDH